MGTAAQAQADAAAEAAAAQAQAAKRIKRVGIPTLASGTDDGLQYMRLPAVQARMRNEKGTGK